MKEQIVFTTPGGEYSPEEKIRYVQEIWARLCMLLLETENNTNLIAYRDETYIKNEIDNTHYYVQIKKIFDSNTRTDKYELRAILPIWNFIAKDSHDMIRTFNPPDWSKKINSAFYDTIVGCRRIRLTITDFWKARQLLDNLAIILLPFDPNTVHEMLMVGRTVLDSEKDKEFKKMLNGNIGFIQPIVNDYGLAQHWLDKKKK